jgi:hypothetical protein
MLALLLLPPAPPADWPTDRLTHVSGVVFPGLLLSEDAGGVEFRVVRRQPGRPTVTLTSRFPKAEVLSVQRLPDAERQRLRERLAALDPASDAARLDAVELSPADWPGASLVARRYASDQFVLVSAAPDGATRRAAVRLEQVSAALVRLLPPRRPVATPTAVYLTGTAAEYVTLLGLAGAGRLANPAVYDRRAGRIVVGTDLTDRTAKLAAARQSHHRQLQTLDSHEADLRRLYKSAPAELERHLRTVAGQRQRLREADKANDRRLDQAVERTLALLAHEAFHAYAATFLYPDGGLPRFLDEGLAQVVESAVLEGGELRVGHADPARLGRAKEAAAGRGDPLLPVAELLAGDPFLARHADRRAVADRAYLTAWAVTHHLLFGRRLPLDDRLTAAGTVAGFERWVGLPAADYDRELADYLRRLRPDGTAPGRSRGPESG